MTLRTAEINSIDVSGSCSMTGTCTENVGMATGTLPNLMGEEIPKRSLVYFISGAGGIKIGFTTDLPSRIKTLNTGSAVPLTVISWVPGDRHLERELHQLLRAHRVKGEWFRDCKEVRAVLALAPDLEVTIETKTKPQDEYVAWASTALSTLAHPRPEREPVKNSIGRVAARLGFKYSRTFELWYGKARTLTIRERDTINAALEAPYV